jgi:excisionase family DNA binding protein
VHGILEIQQLEPLIRKVVAEVLAQLGNGEARSADRPSRSEALAHSATLLLKPREAARVLGISERTLWALTHQNGIPHVRIGRAVRYDPRDLQAWIDRSKQK